MLKRRQKLLALIVLVPFLIYLWPSALGGTTEFLMVQGNSMLPTILPGSLVITKQADSYQIDDIVSFQQRDDIGGKIIVHRIIDETDNGFVIKGDNNPKKDYGLPTEDQIMGKVVFSTPYVGDAVNLFRNPIFLIVAAGVVAVIQTQQTKKKKKKERLRKIRLGIDPNPPKMDKKHEKTKPKKPDFTLFAVALGFNVFTYFAHLLSISANENREFFVGITLEGDILTGFLFKMFPPIYASTIAFGLYLALIIGLFILVKRSDRKATRRIMLLNGGFLEQKKSAASIQISKKAHTVFTLASMGWIMIIAVSIFYFMTFGMELVKLLN